MGDDAPTMGGGNCSDTEPPDDWEGPPSGCSSEEDTEETEADIEADTEAEAEANSAAFFLATRDE
jgi:hypothetical protein